jgi:hypothetical protein
MTADTLRAILDLARWAPSGDNTQPWRFEIVSANHVVVHGFDTRSYCVYDLDGHSSQMAIGALLESIRIAASGYSLVAEMARRTDTPDTRPTFDVRFEAAPVPRNALIDYLPVRCVQRRALRTRRLAEDEKRSLEASVGPRYRVLWLEGLSRRWRAARLLWRNAGLRLTIPEAYEVHRDIIEWHARFSEDRIPEQALGANWLSARLMQFAMKRWSRVAFMNRWLGGTLVPRVELDLAPGLACAAHFMIAADSRPKAIDDYVAAGEAMQRFWLTASALVLQLQPEMTPLIFARYAAEKRSFSRLPNAQPVALAIAEGLAELFGTAAAACGVFMGRIGAGPAASARSLRLPLEKLVVHTP